MLPLPLTGVITGSIVVPKNDICPFSSETLQCVELTNNVFQNNVQGSYSTDSMFLLVTVFVILTSSFIFVVAALSDTESYEQNNQTNWENDEE